MRLHVGVEGKGGNVGEGAGDGDWAMGFSY